MSIDAVINSIQSVLEMAFYGNEDATKKLNDPKFMGLLKKALEPILAERKVSLPSAYTPPPMTYTQPSNVIVQQTPQGTMTMYNAQPMLANPGMKIRKPRQKSAVKRTPNAWQLFSKGKSPQDASALWKRMENKDKFPYHQEANKLKAHAYAEVSLRPPAPKRCTAYGAYCDDVNNNERIITSIISQNPSWQNLPHAEKEKIITSCMGNEFRSLPPDQIPKWENLGRIKTAFDEQVYIDLMKVYDSIAQTPQTPTKFEPQSPSFEPQTPQTQTPQIEDVEFGFTVEP